MRIKLLTFMALSLLTVYPMKAIVSSNVFRVEENIDIELEGDTEDDNKKLLVLPFKAYQVDDAEICVMSYHAHSAVTMRILDAGGTTVDVHSSSLASQQVVSFDISNYPNGTYTLVISTPQGTYLTGVFDVE